MSFISHVPRTLALLIALAACACGGDNPESDKSTAGGQTGGEAHNGAPPGCGETPKPISFDVPGAQGFSPESAFAKFGAEYVAPGTVANTGNTTFRSRLSYAGRSYTVCDVLLLDVTWDISTDDGSFNETFPATLTVSSLERAELRGSVLLADLQGSYRAPEANDSGAKLTFIVSYTPDRVGNVLLRSSSQPESVIADF